MNEGIVNSEQKIELFIIPIIMGKNDHKENNFVKGLVSFTY